MNITICTGPNYPVPAISGGGMARAWFHLGRYFVQMGHSTTLIARSSPSQPKRDVIEGLNILRHGGFNQHASTLLNVAHDFFYAATTTPRLPVADILVLNDFWLPCLAPWLLPRAGKTVLSVNRMPKGQFFLYPKCHHFVAPSDAVAQALSRQTPRLSNRLSVLPNPYDSDSFTPGNRQRQGLLFVGRLHPEKGVHLLLKAFRLLQDSFPDLTLTIAGSSSPALGGGGQRYLHTLKTLALNLKVLWKGPVFDTSELSRLYQSHLIFCYPSLAENGETFGIAPVEAMASGCVPILSQMNVFQSYLQPGINGQFFSHRANHPETHLAESLKQLLANPSHLNRMRLHAIDTASAFSLHEISRRYLLCFQKLLLP